MNNIRILSMPNLCTLFLGIMAQGEDPSTCFYFGDEYIYDEDPMNKEYAMENCFDKDIRPSFEEKSNVNPYGFPTTFDIGDELPKYPQHDGTSISRMNEILDGIDTAVGAMEEGIAELNGENSKLISELADSVDKLIFEIEGISDESTGEMGCDEQGSDEFFDALSNVSAVSDECFDIVNDKTIIDDKFEKDVGDEDYSETLSGEIIHEPGDGETVGKSEYQNSALVNEMPAKTSKQEKKNINDQSMELAPEMDGLMNFFTRIRHFLSYFLD